MDFVGGFIIGAIVAGVIGLGVGIYLGAGACYLGAKALGWLREIT